MAIPLAIGFWSVFSSILVPMLVRAGIALGVGTVTYLGVKALVDSAKANIQSQFAGFTSDMLDVISVMRVDDAITVIFSAIVARLSIKGLTAAGAISKVKWSLPTGS